MHSFTLFCRKKELQPKVENGSLNITNPVLLFVFFLKKNFLKVPDIKTENIIACSQSVALLSQVAAQCLLYSLYCTSPHTLHACHIQTIVPLLGCPARVTFIYHRLASGLCDKGTSLQEGSGVDSLYRGCVQFVAR